MCTKHNSTTTVFIMYNYLIKKFRNLNFSYELGGIGTVVVLPVYHHVQFITIVFIGNGLKTMMEY